MKSDNADFDAAKAIIRPYVPAALNMISKVTVILLKAGAFLEAIEKSGGKDAIPKQESQASRSVPTGWERIN